jgi:hypothetical protein
VRPGTVDIEMRSTPSKVVALFDNTIEKNLALTSVSLTDHMQFASAEGVFSDVPNRSPATLSPMPVLNTFPPLAQQPAKQREAKKPYVAPLPGVAGCYQSSSKAYFSSSNRIRSSLPIFLQLQLLSSALFLQLQLLSVFQCSTQCCGA